MPIGERLHGARRTCGRNTTRGPVCHHVLKDLATRPVERSLGFTVENNPSMRLNHTAYGGSKSSSIREDPQKRERMGNDEIPRFRMEDRRQTSGEKYSVIRQRVGAVVRTFSTSKCEAAK